MKMVNGSTRIVKVTDEEVVFIVGVLLGFFVSFPTTFLILEVSKWLMN